MNYPVADYLIQVKNAYMASRNEVVYPYSKVVLAIAQILKEEGYIKDVKEEVVEERKTIKSTLLYRGNDGALTNVQIISKPSLHKYVGKQEVRKVANKFSTAILSTNQGIVSNKKAVKLGVGGELLAKVS